MNVPVSEDEELRRRRAYIEAEDDIELAEMLGLSLDAASKWRRTRGLPPRGHRVPPRLDDEAAFRAYQASSSDAEAAARLGCTPTAFLGWRQRHALRPTSRRITSIEPGRTSRLRRRWEAYCLADTMSEACEMVGIPQSSMARWIKHQGLHRMNRPAYRQAEIAAAARGDPIAIRGCQARGWRVMPRLPATEREEKSPRLRRACLAAPSGEGRRQSKSTIGDSMTKGGSL